MLCARFGLRFGRLYGGSDGRCADRSCRGCCAGEFIYTGPLVIPPTGGKQIYSCNEGNALAWDPAIRDAVDEFKVPSCRFICWQKNALSSLSPAETF